MDLFPFLYFFAQLIIIGFILFNSLRNRWLYNVLVTLNLMLFVYSLYLVRMLIGLIQFVRSIIGVVELSNYSNTTYLAPIVRLTGMVLLPFFFLIPYCRKNLLFTILVCFYTGWNFTPNYLNVFDVVQKILFCICMFSTIYSLLWLFKRLPSQKDVL